MATDENQKLPNPFIVTEPSVAYPGGKLLTIHYPDGMVASVYLLPNQVADLIADLSDKPRLVPSSGS